MGQFTNPRGFFILCHMMVLLYRKKRVVGASYNVGICVDLCTVRFLILHIGTICICGGGSQRRQPVHITAVRLVSGENLPAYACRGYRQVFGAKVFGVDNQNTMGKLRIVFVWISANIRLCSKDNFTAFNRCMKRDGRRCFFYESFDRNGAIGLVSIVGGCNNGCVSFGNRSELAAIIHRYDISVGRKLGNLFVDCIFRQNSSNQRLGITFCHFERAFRKRNTGRIDFFDLNN